METFIAVMDAAILLWLVGTWFYEGHHRRCRVDVECPSCGAKSEHDCGRSPR